MKAFTILDRITFDYPNQDPDWNIRKNKNRYFRLLISLALKFSNQWVK
jgi:hypothetical protein